MAENVAGSWSRGDRKVIERNRRSQMRALCSQLTSLVPRHQSSREVISLPDQLDEATTYIKKLQMRLEKMKEKKLSLIGTADNKRKVNGSLINNRGIIKGSKSPKIEIHQMGSALDVSAITGLDCQFIFNEFIRILHEEQADIVNASYSVVQDAVFHTIQCQIGECGNRAERISERLRRFVYGSGAF